MVELRLKLIIQNRVTLLRRTLTKEVKYDLLGHIKVLLVETDNLTVA